MRTRNRTDLRRSFFRFGGLIGLCSVAVGMPACDDIAYIDAKTDALMKERSEALGGGAIAPRRAGVPGEAPRGRITEYQPPSTNPGADQLNFAPASEARDVQARLTQYGAIASEGSIALDLRGALRQSQETGREFITAEEEYILAAIRLLIERHLWSPQFFATISPQVVSTNPEFGGSTTAFQVVNELRATQRLPFGGQVEARYLYTLTEQLRRAVGDRFTTSNQLILSGTLPLLRGAGDVAREDLIQAERNLVYAARTFENFRRQYLVEIASDYFDLVLLKSQIKNQEQVLDLLRRLEDRTRALVAAGRLSEFQQNIAASDVLSGTTSLANLRESYLLALDRFKIRLGLNVNTNLDIQAVDIGLPSPDVTPDAATAAALEYRLDLQTRRDVLDDTLRGVNNAKNALLPDLNLFGSATVGSGSAVVNDFVFQNDGPTTLVGGVTFGLPLNREVERLNLRQATINAERARRDFEEFRDQVVVDVRARVRELDRAQFDLDLQRRSVYINERRAEEQEIKKDEVSPQEVVDSATSLLRALNARDQALNDLRRAVLNYLLSSGQLRVERDGMLQPLAGMDLTFKPVEPYRPPGGPDAPAPATPPPPADPATGGQVVNPSTGLPDDPPGAPEASPPARP